MMLSHAAGASGTLLFLTDKPWLDHYYRLLLSLHTVCFPFLSKLEHLNPIPPPHPPTSKSLVCHLKPTVHVRCLPGCQNRGGWGVVRGERERGIKGSNSEQWQVYISFLTRGAADNMPFFWPDSRTCSLLRCLRLDKLLSTPSL